MGESETDVSGIRAALSDLLPVLMPGATFDPATDEVLLPVEGGRARLSIDSLIAGSSDVSPNAWPRLVADWSNEMLARVQRPVPPLEADQLRVRLVPTRTVDEDLVVVRPYGVYFQLELMADLGDQNVWVGPSRVADIGLSPDDGFTTGLRNTIQKVLVQLDVRHHEVAGGLTISLAAADGSPWVSAGLTSVANLFRAPELPYGALVAVPRMSAALFTRVESDRVTADILVIGRLVADMHRDSDDPCSPDLFWLHGGALYRIDRGDGTKVTLPVELEPVVASLPKS